MIPSRHPATAALPLESSDLGASADAIGRMKVWKTYLILLITRLHCVLAEELQPIGDDLLLTPQENRNGWVNPEDLAPIPQCIFQQDTSTWLSAMTECTGKQCTRHFGVICTHHQWLTQLSCLNTKFSTALVADYIQYCDRSILAKTQLYWWIHGITGRTWLVDVGDANEAQNLSPTSLAQAYAAVSEASRAPTCLFFHPGRSAEPFGHVMSSCRFTGTARHTGRADRPWEYREDLHSMTILDSETASYDLTQGNIADGDYFDKKCFCNFFNIDTEKELCSGIGNLDWTQALLWMKVTCGPRAIPGNWTKSLKMTGRAYTPFDEWQWPACVADMPMDVTGLTQQCATDACGLDSLGYCEVERTVDRECFCRSITYDSCGESCKAFEIRIDYVNWLHGVCGDIQDWHGLPDDWRRLAELSTTDMIPWEWTVEPSNSTRSKLAVCPSNDQKLGSLVLVHVLTALFCIFGPAVHQSHQRPDSSSWFSTGILVTFIQLFANFLNATLIQLSPGYTHIPTTHLILLWSTLPRLSWVPFLLLILRPFPTINFSAIRSLLLAEVILQTLSIYYILTTAKYGFSHSFYSGRLADLEKGQLAQVMYFGALSWLIIATTALIWSIRAARGLAHAAEPREDDPPARPSAPLREAARLSARLSAQVEEVRTYLGEELEHRWEAQRRAADERRPLFVGKGKKGKTYGAIHAQSYGPEDELRRELGKWCAVTLLGLFLVWVAQWLFWVGFIGVSSEMFCLPRLGLLTAVWVISSVASIAVGVTM